MDDSLESLVRTPEMADVEDLLRTSSVSAPPPTAPISQVAIPSIVEPNDWASSAGDPSSPTLGGDSGGDYDKEDSADDPVGGNQGFVGPSLLTKESLRRMWKKCGFSRDIEARIPLEEERPWSAPPGWVCLYS